MNDSGKILTISISAYNAAGTISRTLSSVESALALLDDPDVLDVLVVDDGSTDDTAEAAEDFARRHPGIFRVISQANGGYGSAVNTGVDAARGEYFKLLDSDDAFDPEGLRELVRTLAATDADLVLTPYRIVRSPIQLMMPDSRSDHDRDDNKVHACDNLAELTEGSGTGLSMFEICVRTSVLRNSGVRLTEHCYYTDNEFALAAGLYSGTVARCPHPVYIYSLGVDGQSMSIAGRRAHYEDKFRAARGVLEISQQYLDRNVNGTQCDQKNIIESMAGMMVREVYLAALIQEDPVEERARLREFDREIQDKWPELAGAAGGSKLVRTARKAGPLAYRLLSNKVLRDEERRVGAANDLTGWAVTDLTTGKPTDDTNAGLTREVILQVLEYVVAACMIVQCRTVWMHLYKYGMMVNRGVWIVMMIALVLCTLMDNRSGVGGRNVRILASFALISVYAGIFILVNPVNYLRVIRCALAVFMMIALTLSHDGKAKIGDILICFRNLMVVVAAVSLFCWLFGTVMNLLPCTGDAYIDWTKTGGYDPKPTFLHIYYETQWTGWKVVDARNSGIFVEAPMAGFAYSAALLIEYGLNRQTALKGKYSHNSTAKDTLPNSAKSLRPKEIPGRDHIIRTVILIAAIITTISVISYIFLFLLAAAEAIRVLRNSAAERTIAELNCESFSEKHDRIVNYNRDDKNNDVAGVKSPEEASLRSAVIIIAAVAILAVIAALAWMVYVKITRGSGSVRLDDFAVGLHAWLAHPIFGGGFESLEYLQGFMPEWRMGYDIGFSNSPMEILAQGGIYLGAAYIFAFVRPFVRAVKQRDAKLITVLVLCAYLFTFTVVPYQYITFFALVYLNTGAFR